MIFKVEQRRNVSLAQLRRQGGGPQPPPFFLAEDRLKGLMFAYGKIHS
jgi:hypothetical protein